MSPVQQLSHLSLASSTVLRRKVQHRGTVRLTDDPQRRGGKQSWLTIGLHRHPPLQGHGGFAALAQQLGVAEPHADLAQVEGAPDAHHVQKTVLAAAGSVAGGSQIPTAVFLGEAVVVRIQVGTHAVASCAPLAQRLALRPEGHSACVE